MKSQLLILILWKTHERAKKNAKYCKKWQDFKKNWVIETNLDKLIELDYIQSEHQIYTIFISFHLLFILCKYVL